MSDGTLGTPAVGEVSCLPLNGGPTDLTYADVGSGPNLYTVGTQAMGIATGETILMTRNGTSFALAFTVFYY
jgi:hypothetical protein